MATPELPTFVNTRDNQQIPITSNIVGGVIEVVNVVTDFGADPTGAIDSTSAIQNSINSLPATGGIVFVPAGVYSISSTIIIGNGTTTTVSSINNIELVGAGAGNTPGDSIFPGAATRLVWNGSSGGIMLQINGPISAVTIAEMALDCNNIAAQGMVVFHIYSSRIANILIEQFTAGPAFQMQGRDNPITGMVRGCDDNFVERLKVYDTATSSANAVALGTPTPPNSITVGMSRNTFIGCFFAGGATGTGLTLQYMDNNSFFECFITTQSGTPLTANALNIVPPPTADTFPQEVQFYNCAIVGTKTVTGTWQPIGNTGVGFWPASTSDDRVNTLIHPNSWGVFGTITRFHQGEARTQLTSAKTIPNGVETAVAWDVVNFDGSSFLNLASHPTRFTAFMQGVYKLSAGVDFATTNTNSSCYMYFRVNGTTQWGLVQALANKTIDTWLQLSDAILLQQNDYVELIVFQNSGGNLNVVNASGTYMTMIFIGN